MAGIKLELPQHFAFSAIIPIRITDINYGGHVGNDTVLSIMHEARVQFLQHCGFASELNTGGVGWIMSDVTIQFKKELFYGDSVKASVSPGAFSKVGFDLFYKLEKETAGELQTVALAKTGMVCYDYNNKKIVAIPEEVRGRLG